ncbi:DUF5134 domain-containing protein [Solwaraspora sp. WMMD406]|uniref:DUF5134 domain-containing protein n=1 Tax=Solwaraspora sp. WMMD406 TaxID=3016095 RepID=UPI0024177DA8|nr:DUF5134 domain-containing protein [Solwaraspora sp. WMMD406]MDG4764923.1 DUF5134 domain-containing protein [Solwaraspora sp. WMMD406]
MLETPWVPVLTVVFLLTGLFCVGDLVVRRRGVPREQAFSDAELIDINHAVMSAAMILMAWLMVDGVFAWAQVAIFGILAFALLPAYLRARGRSERVDVLGHATQNLAMIWMLAAMPTLMSEMGIGGGSGHAHGVAAAGAVPTPTPAWADMTNVAFVVVSAIGALWWLYRAATTRSGHRLHLLGYAVMGAGMGTMLLLMNS